MGGGQSLLASTVRELGCHHSMVNLDGRQEMKRRAIKGNTSYTSESLP